MGGNKASPPEAPGESARTEARHWRALALEREAQLRALTRRPLVRLAMRLDRPVSSVTGAIGQLRRRARRPVDRLAVAAAAATAVPHRSRRRTAIGRELSRLEPAGPSRRGVVAIVDPTTTASGRASDTLSALAREARASTAEVLCFLPASDAPDPRWLDRLAAAIDDGAVAATPTLLHPRAPGWPASEHELLVRSAGLEIELDAAGGPVAVARGVGETPDVAAPSRPVAGAPMSCLVVRRDAFLDAGGLESTTTLGDDATDVAALDLCMRLQRRGGRVVHVPAALAYDGRPVRARRALRHPMDPSSGGWRWLVDNEGPALRAAARPSAPRSWVITTAAPSMKVATRWGDWHFAEGLARALQAMGEEAAVQTHPQADSAASRSGDVHLVLRGLAPVRRTPGQRHVLWVISHPERVEARECDEADLVLVASPRFAEELRLITTTPVEVLLQATDPHRFQPRPVDAAHQHAVTVVAKTRDVVRPVVTDALAAGVRPAIYGSGWQGLVDSDLLVTDSVENHLLPTVYSSAGVVLNDHWDTMRDRGFISNRLFDVLACGTPVISDPVEGLDDVFDGAVPSYRTPAELAELIHCALAHPDRARARAAKGRAIVLAQHTFDHRARALLTLLERYGLSPRETDRTNE